MSDKDRDDGPKKCLGGRYDLMIGVGGVAGARAVAVQRRSDGLHEHALLRAVLNALV